MTTAPDLRSGCRCCLYCRPRPSVGLPLLFATAAAAAAGAFCSTRQPAIGCGSRGSMGSGGHQVAVQLRHQSFKRAVTCLFTVKAHNILTKILIKPCYGLEKAAARVNRRYRPRPSVGHCGCCRHCRCFGRAFCPAYGPPTAIEAHFSVMQLL